MSIPLVTATGLASRDKIASCSLNTILEINMVGATIGSVKSTPHDRMYLEKSMSFQARIRIHYQ